MYKLFKGQPAKYIKVSKTETVFAQPLIIALRYTDLETGKDIRITNIGQDHKVITIQVQILKELLNVSHGYLNVPKAFYAKVKQYYDTLLNGVSLPNEFCALSYRDKITVMKTALDPKMTVDETVALLAGMRELEIMLKNIPQGIHHAVYLAFEYIISKRGNGVQSKDYSFLELCDKCYHELVQREGGKLYFKDKKKSYAFFVTLALFVTNACPELGISDLKIKLKMPSGDTVFTVFFSWAGSRAKLRASPAHGSP
jgi:hypothetical protein